MSYWCLKNAIHQVGRKNEWLLLSVTFTAKHEMVFVLTFKNALEFLKVSAEGAKNVSQLWLSPLRGWVVWIWHSLVNLYIWLTIWSCYSSIPLTLGLLERDGGLSTLSHSCWFSCQQRVLKTFPGHGYLHSEDEVVWLWHSLVNL